MKAKVEEQRINLNDLLRKAQEQKKEERKTNIIIVSSVLSLAVLVFIVFSF